MLLRRILVVPSWIAIVLAVIALLIGGWLGIIVLAMVGAYLLAWVLLPVIGRVAARVVELLEKRRTEFTNALIDVTGQCPEHCRGDLSVPQCQLE